MEQISGTRVVFFVAELKRKNKQLVIPYIAQVI